MHFTREPIVETVITPKEGHKLVLRNSKGGSQEEFFVDAVEVVSFGNSLFFCSTEQSKSFLVPVSDYEVLELKEARMVLKNAPYERSIKIGGNRENSGRRPKELSVDLQKETLPKKRERKRSCRRKGSKGEPEKEKPVTKGEAFRALPPLEGEEEERKELKKLFPPPSTLIKERLSSYKTAEIIAEDFIPKDLREMQKEEVELKGEKVTKESEEDILNLSSDSPPPSEKEEKDTEDSGIVEKTSKDEALVNKDKE